MKNLLHKNFIVKVTNESLLIGSIKESYKKKGFLVIDNVDYITKNVRLTDGHTYINASADDVEVISPEDAYTLISSKLFHLSNASDDLRDIYNYINEAKNLNDSFNKK